MRYLQRSNNSGILIEPRGPYKQVAVSEEAYGRLEKVQSQLLQHGLSLVLTRGYEYEGTILKILHKAMRILSAIIFGIIYPRRIKECREIFSAKGHDHNGDNVDIGIVCSGQTLGFLPMGAFTSAKSIKRTEELNHNILKLVRNALESQGFVIHSNKTEALQIHCHISNTNGGDHICK